MGSFIGIVIVLGALLAFFAFLSWLAYLVIYFPTAWLIKPNRLRKARLILSPTTVILVLAIYFSTHGPSNDDTATLENVGDGYQITLTGQRLYMVHDPITFLLQETYLDSTVIIVPRATGIINGQEIQSESGEKSGTLTIDHERLKVDLYYDNTDDKEKVPSDWNGKYKLKWRSDH